MPATTLYIRQLELSLHIGWSDKERSKKRSVLLDLDIHFQTPPAACETDELADTVCYARLSAIIQEKIAAKSYKLIEHLCADIYSCIKKNLPDKARLIVRIIKYPKIAGLKNGVCFAYGDDHS